MGGKSEDPMMPVTAYYASVHYGICAGPVDEILEVHYGEKLLVEGSITESQTLFIDEPELFGGAKVEGGFAGNMAFMLGESNQLVPDALALGLQRNGASVTADPTKLPGYRGIFSVYIYGTASVSTSLWGG